jgi:hypothetical protein
MGPGAESSELPDGPWLPVARNLEPTPIVLPDRLELVALLERLGVEPEDAVELPGVLADVLADPRLHWLATRYATMLVRDLGVLGLPTTLADPTRKWPVLPLSDGPAARCVYLPAFLATVQQVRALHHDRGIPDNVSWATLVDFGRQISVHRRTFGVLGTDTAWWTAIAWNGSLLDLGRLQVEWLTPGTVGLHIPESGPLTPEAVDASLDRVRASWPTWFGTKPEQAECVSWLLDPQLAEFLPPDSNMVRFQRRFTLDDDPGAPADQSALYFVFRRRDLPLPAGLAELPRNTGLQRGIIDKLAAGGHWHFRRGWFAL